MCSLQEAYLVPSFTASVNRKCPPAQAKASAEAYDPFFPEGGRGERTMYMKEGFKNRGGRSHAREPFVGGMEPTNRQLGLRDNVSYASQATDNDFYCRTYGVCTTPDSKPIPKPNLDVPTTGRLEGFSNPNPNENCIAQSAKPLRYEYPMSPEAKTAYEKALHTSLSADTYATQTIPVEAQMRTDDLSKIQGFEDEDLEKYLQTKDMKAAPMISIPTTSALDAKPYDPKESPFAKAMQHFAKEENKTPQVLKNNMAGTEPMVDSVSSSVQKIVNVVKKSETNIWDLMIFVLVGVLFIFLCDQLFRLGVMMGMKRTVELLEPFLEKA